MCASSLELSSTSHTLLSFLGQVGLRNRTQKHPNLLNLLVMEGYFFYQALVTVFETNRMSTVVHYLVGYGVPVVIIIITTSITLAGYDVYLKKDNLGNTTACFLSVDAIWAMIVPALLVAVVNCFVTIRAIIIAHRATSRKYSC